jgi:hypothetical protein
MVSVFMIAPRPSGDEAKQPRLMASGTEFAARQDGQMEFSRWCAN